MAFRRSSATTSSEADSSTRTGPIARLVREKLSGKGDEDKDDAFGFTADDLNLSVDDVNRAGQAAREVAGALTSEPAFRELAATMINEQLGPSVSEVFGVGGDDLKQILTDVRVEMDKQGLELLVLIEDFSIFQGIQGGLIDAITLISTEAQRLCPMRVVMAVTTGYFINQMPETVYTRTYRVFDLDLPDGIECVVPASRVRGSIPQRRSSRGNGARCSTCSAGMRCPTPANSAPSTRNATHRSARSTATASSRSTPPPSTAPSRANPRTAVSWLATCSPVSFGRSCIAIRPRLTTAASRATASPMTSGPARATAWRTSRTSSNCGRPETRNSPNVAFGSSDFGAQGRARKTSRRRSMTPSESRRSTVSTIRNRRSWTPVRLRPPSLRRLPPRLHNQSLRIRRSSRPSMAGSQPATSCKAKSTTFETSSSRRFDSDSRSTTDTAATVCGATTRPSHQGSKRRWSSSAKRRSLALSCRWTDRTPDDMRALRALAWANHKNNWAEVPDGERLQRLTETAIDRWATRVGGTVLPPQRPNDDTELARLVEVLLSIARALGIADAFKSDTASRIRALFAPIPARTDLESRAGLRSLHGFLVDGAGSGNSVTRVGRGQLQQRLLRHASYSQGSGKPLALDLSKVAKVVRSGAAGAPWPESTPDLVKSSVSTIEARLASIDSLHAEASNLVPDLSDLGGDLADVAAELLVLVNERADAGALPGGINPADLQAAAKAVKPGDQRKVEATFAELSRWDQLTIEEKLQVLNGDWDEPARRVGTWLRMARQTVRLLEHSLGNGSPSDVQREYAEARDQLIADLTAMADSISTPATEDSSGPEELA